MKINRKTSVRRAEEVQNSKADAKFIHTKQVVTVVVALVLIVTMGAFAHWLQVTWGSEAADVSNLGTEEPWITAVSTDTTNILNSNYSSVKLYIPCGESDEFKADTAFSYSYYVDGASNSVPKTVTYNAENVIFSFFDNSQTSYNRDGLVWLIYKYSMDDLDSLVESDSEWGNNVFLLNWHILGYDDNTIYALFSVGMGFGDPCADQLEWDELGSVQSYYDHLETGLVVLENFVIKNGLAAPKECVDWKSWYQENMLGKAKAQIDNLAAAQARNSKEK